jgi:hypothetical protein
MPFKSKAQVRACYAHAVSMKRQGKPNTWNCEEWMAETPNEKKLPARKKITKKKTKKKK